MEDQEWLNSQESQEDYQAALSWLRTKARTNRKNPQRYMCPTCGTEQTLSHWEHSHGDGDGLYASYDGWQIILRAPRTGGMDHYITLERDVYKKLQDFANRIWKKDETQE